MRGSRMDGVSDHLVGLEVQEARFQKVHHLVLRMRLARANLRARPVEDVKVQQ